MESPELINEPEVNVAKSRSMESEFDNEPDGDSGVLPLKSWPKMIIKEIMAIPSVLREMDFRFVLLIVIASLCAILARMVGKLARGRDFITWLWGSEASENLLYYAKIHWATFYITGYLIIPALAVLLIFRRPLTEYGLGIGRLKKHMPFYALLIALAIPMVFIASQTEVFLNKYPKMPSTNLQEFVLLETLYVLQFLGVEFFFRGFILFPSVRKFGIAGVMLPILPYCMLHFAKPIPEAIGSIFAGMLLGYYAWKSRSIWGGVALHGLVAVSMDTLAIINKRGGFFLTLLGLFLVSSAY